MNHVTIGLYANESYVINVVHPAHLDYHIEYNKVMRFGRALFVDGKCVHQGYLSAYKVAEWENKIKDILKGVDTSKPSIEYH